MPQKNVKLIDNPNADLGRAWKWAADRPLNIHTDGEIFDGFGVDVRELSVEIIPAALQVLV
jgi:diacylglycerol kinase family enzyme